MARFAFKSTLVVAASVLLAGIVPSNAYIPGWELQKGTAADDIVVAHDVIPTTTNVAGVDFVMVGHSASARALVGGSDCEQFSVGSGTTACGAVDLFIQRIGGKAGETIWQFSYGSSGNDVAASIASDSDGQTLYVLGQSTAARGRRQAAVPQSYMLKVDAGNGTLVSSRTIGDRARARVIASFVKVDPTSGDVFVVGTSNAAVTPDGEPCSKPKGATDVFVCRMVAEDLSYKWCRSIGTSADERVPIGSSSLAFDMHGNSFVAGTTNGRFNSTSGSGAASSTTDAFTAKLDGNGNIGWVRQLGDPTANDEGVAIAYDPWNEKVYITGWTVGTFGDRGNRNRGDKDIFVAQYDAAAGAVGWTKMYGGSGEEYPTDLASFHERLFLIATENGPNWETYWTDPDGTAPKNNNGTIRMFYNSRELGGSDWLACEIVHVVDDGEFDWTGVPKGMPRWCSLFGSTADDISTTIRVDQNYNISLPGVIDGQMVNTLTGSLFTSYGGKDIGFELYYEYDLRECCDEGDLGRGF
jgi:hypothetical protein